MIGSIERLRKGRGRAAGGSSAVPGLGDDGGSRRKPAAGWVRGGALLSLVGLLGSGMVLGDHFTAEPSKMTDGTAWVARGDDLVRGSSYTNAADWLVSGAADETVAPDGIGQDGSDVVVVVGQKAFTIDQSSMKPSKSVPVAAKSQALVRTGRAFLVGDGRVDCIRPGIGTLIGKPVRVPGRGRGVVDDKGVLWVASRRDGRIYEVRNDGKRCTLERKVDGVFPAGNDVEITLAGGRVVLYDRDTGVVSWIDPRTGEASATATIAKGGRVQGPSSQGDQVWISGPGKGLTGVDRAGKVVRTELSVGSLLRPEVLEDGVVVASSTGSVVAVRTEAGKAPDEVRRTPLAAARQKDFQTFVKDEQAWFNAQKAKQAGTIAANGDISKLAVDEKKLKDEAAKIPPKVQDLTPITAPPVSEPGPVPTPQPTGTTPAPSPRPDPVTPNTQPTIELDPSPSTSTPPSSTSSSAPSSTSTTLDTRPTVPNLAGLRTTEACQRVVAAGLRCDQQELPGSGTPTNTVIEQAPAMGTRLAAGQPVTVRYHPGYVVPDVRGLPKTGACAPIIEAGLECQVVDAPSPTAVAPSTTWDQSVEPGTEAPKGTTVTISADNVQWVPVVICHEYNTYATTFALNASCPATWDYQSIGDLATTRAPGTVRIIRYRPDPSGPQTSMALRPEGQATPAGWVPDGTLGYAYPTQIPGTLVVSRAAAVSESPRDEFFAMDGASPSLPTPLGYCWAPVSNSAMYYTWPSAPYQEYRRNRPQSACPVP